MRAPNPSLAPDGDRADILWVAVDNPGDGSDVTLTLMTRSDSINAGGCAP